MPSSINYSQFFTRLGRFVEQFNTYNSWQSDLLFTANVGLQDILPEFTTRPDLVANLSTQYQGFASNVASWENALYSFTNGLISDLQQQLNAPTSSPASILPLMSADMAAQSTPVTIMRNTASAPARATAASSNTGNGILLLMANSALGYPDERILNETVSAVCTADANTGATAGAEKFSITGYPASNSPYTVTANPTGNGTINNFGTADNNSQYNFLSNANGSFDSYNASSQTFSSWTTPTFAGSASYTSVYTWVSATGESPPSPASAAVAVAAGQAIGWVLPALITGATGLNLYMNNGSGAQRLQFSKLPGGMTWPVGEMLNGKAPPTVDTSGLGAPTAALTGTAYTPSLPSQDTQRTWPETGGGALFLSASSAGPVFIRQSLASLKNFSGAWAFGAAMAQYSGATGSQFVVAIVNATPEFQAAVNGDPDTSVQAGAYAEYYTTFWGSNTSPNSQIYIVWSNSVAGMQILIDSMNLAQAQDFGNVQCFLIRGSVDFQVGDSFSWTTTNNNAGKFQTFFGDYYGAQLNSSLTPTISDSLIT